MTKFTWIQILVAVFQLISSAAGACSDTPVGVRDELKVIPDGSMNASSALTSFPAKDGRLAGKNAWCPLAAGNDSDPYLTIDLGRNYEICGVEVQGKPGATESTNFTLQFSINGLNFIDVDSGQTFHASSAGGNITTFHSLTTAVTATHLRFKPVSNDICLRVEIYAVPEDVSVTCQASNILVEIQKSLFTNTDPAIAATDLALKDRNCKATNGSTTFDFDITLGTCQTALTISNDEARSFYRNVVFNTTAEPDEAEFNIICSYERTPTAASGTGALTFTMNIHTDENHQTPVGDTVIALGQKLYFKIEVQTTSSDIELHLTQCKATPTNNVNDANSYIFIQSGCHVQSDQFVTDYNCSATPTNTQTFTLSAFRFASGSAGDRVYFHCNALACLISNSASTCTTQCNACTSRRKRRNLEEQDPNEVHLVLGPFTIVEEGKTTGPTANENDSEEDSNTIQEDSENFPTTWVVIFCAGAMVAMAIIIGLVVMMRLSKNSRGPAVKNVTADLAQDNAAFDDTDVKTLSVKST